MKTALRRYIDEMVAPLAGNAPLRQRLLEIRSAHDRVIDEVSLDVLLNAEGVVDFDKARGVIASWKEFLNENRDEIALIHVLYSQPKGARVTYRELSDLAERLKSPPRSWTVGLIWSAYQAIERDRVKQSNVHTATDLISLIRYSLGFDHELIPFADVIEERFQGWLAEQAKMGATFTEIQLWWLERIKDTIVQSAQFGVGDLDLAPFTERGGSDGIGRDLGSQAQAIIEDMNRALAV